MQHTITKPAFFQKKNRIITATLVALLLALQTGCTMPKSLFDIFKKDSSSSEYGIGTAESLAMDGLDKYNHGRYAAALKIFEDIKSRFPFSAYSLLAELKAADCQYYEKNYEEALVLYQEFIDRHPTNEAIPYILFQIGMCHYQQITTIDRDTSGATNATQAFARLLRTAPDSPYTEEAKARLMAAKTFLANHELYVATYYVRTESFKQAESRLEYLIRTYPETSVASEAESLLAAVRSDNPPTRTWRDWLPEFSLPDWRAFTFGLPSSSGAGAKPPTP